MASRKKVLEERDAGIAVNAAAFPKAADDAPPPFTTMLTNGVIAKWRMPDPFVLIAFSGIIPDPTTAAVIQLLNEEKALTNEADPRKYIVDAQKIRGMYGLVSHMLEEPRFDPKLEYGDGKEVLGRRDIGFHDVCQLYWAFRITPYAAARTLAQSDDTGGAEDSSFDGDAIRNNAG